MNDQPTPPVRNHNVAVMAMASVTLLWIAGPPLSIWAVAFVALVPWMRIIASESALNRHDMVILWAASTLYWLIALQGLRHAHPAMYACWFALAGYLAVYHVLFVSLSRRLLARRLPLVFVAPLVWLTLEWVRNYLLTGISVAMLGHAMANVPWMIQIADLQGSYAVGGVLVIVNVAVFKLYRFSRRELPWQACVPTWITATMLLAATIGYGVYRMGQPLGQPTATFALIQRDEEVEYEQSYEREIEMFQNYARQTIEAVESHSQRIDAVVWPESMFTGGSPWMTAAPDAHVPQYASSSGDPMQDAPMSTAEFQQGVLERQQYFLERAQYVQNAIVAETPGQTAPHLISGCGVVHYAESPEVYCGVVHLTPDGSLDDWYGKNHLVMFGEYIPIAPYIPGLNRLIPPGMGLRTGAGPKAMDVEGTIITPNICIETAVERVTVNHLALLKKQNKMADVVVTVTNDGWFDDSSVIEHHLRCAQLVAAGCRRPILSSANNGPTAWIDSRGQIVERLPTGAEGAVIATPKQDPRSSVYLAIGDWPSRIAVIVCGILLLTTRRRRRCSSENLAEANSQPDPQTC